MDYSAKLKSLQSRRSRTRQRIDAIKQELSDMNRELSRALSLEKKLTEEIQQMTTEEVQVSEHAILRYLQRVEGLNIDEIRQQVISEDLLGEVQSSRQGVFQSNRGYKLVVRNGIVTTVMTDQGQKE